MTIIIYLPTYIICMYVRIIILFNKDVQIRTYVRTYVSNTMYVCVQYVNYSTNVGVTILYSHNIAMFIPVYTHT